MKRHALLMAMLIGTALALVGVGPAQARPGDATREFVEREYCGAHYIAGEHVWTADCEAFERQRQEIRQFVLGQVCGEHWVGDVMVLEEDCRQFRDNIDETKRFVLHQACREYSVGNTTVFLVDCRQTRDNIEETEEFGAYLLDDTLPDLHELP